MSSNELKAYDFCNLHLERQQRRADSGEVTRRDQQQRQAERGGKLDFSAEEIPSLLKASNGWLHACILLGINGGMGNADESMAAVYRQGIEDQRLIDVGQQVHVWLLPPGKPAKKTAKRTPSNSRVTGLVGRTGKGQVIIRAHRKPVEVSFWGAERERVT